MQKRSLGDFELAGREMIAEGADMQAQVLTLSAGQCIPWHYHNEIFDTMICLEGSVIVETRAPRHEYALAPGQRCSVPPKTAHYVHGKDGSPCKFLNIQGVGVYDFMPVG